MIQLADNGRRDFALTFAALRQHRTSRRARELFQSNNGRRDNLFTAGTRRRRCGNTILIDKADDCGRLPRADTRRFV
jgi:hypothetical protein